MSHKIRVEVYATQRRNKHQNTWKRHTEALDRPRYIAEEPESPNDGVTSSISSFSNSS